MGYQSGDGAASGKLPQPARRGCGRVHRDGRAARRRARQAPHRHLRHGGARRSVCRGAGAAGLLGGAGQRQLQPHGPQHPERLPRRAGAVRGVATPHPGAGFWWHRHASDLGAGRRGWPGGRGAAGPRRHRWRLRPHRAHGGPGRPRFRAPSRRGAAAARVGARRERHCMGRATLMATMLGGVVLPRVYVQESEPDWQGKLIRRWSLRTRPLEWSQFTAIEELVREVGIARSMERAVDGTPYVLGASQVALILDEGGGRTTTAMVYITSYRVVRPLSLPQRREIELQLEEA